MKNSALIVILLIGVAILGFLFMNKENNQTQNTNESTPFVEEGNTQTTPSTPLTIDQSTTNNGLLSTYKTFGNLTFKAPKDFLVQQRDSGERSTVVVNDSKGNLQFSILKTKDCDYDVEPGSSPAGCITQETFIKNFGNRYTEEEQMSKSGRIYSSFPKLVSEEKTRIIFADGEKEVTRQTVLNNGNTEYYYYPKEHPFVLIITTADNQKFVEFINFSSSQSELDSASQVR